jgi:hypothetical protein
MLVAVATWGSTPMCIKTYEKINDVPIPHKAHAAAPKNAKAAKSITFFVLAYKSPSLNS